MNDNTETVMTIERAGVAYEIDHLGISYADQYGEYAIYRKEADGTATQIGEFDTDAAGFKPGMAPPLPDAEHLRLLALQQIWELENEAETVGAKP